MSPAGSWCDPVIVASSGEETDTADEFQMDSLSSQSPPDHKRGPQLLENVLKSPVYPLLHMTAQKNPVFLVCRATQDR